MRYALCRGDRVGHAEISRSALRPRILRRRCACIGSGRLSTGVVDNCVAGARAQPVVAGPRVAPAWRRCRKLPPSLAVDRVRAGVLPTTSVLNVWLMSISCSRLFTWTSWLMYSLGSVSAVGSWFCISVTSSVRKSLAEMVAELCSHLSNCRRRSCRCVDVHGRCRVSRQRLPCRQCLIQDSRCCRHLSSLLCSCHVTCAPGSRHHGDVRAAQFTRVCERIPNAGLCGAS